MTELHPWRTSFGMSYDSRPHAACAGCKWQEPTESGWCFKFLEYPGEYCSQFSFTRDNKRVKGVKYVSH